LKNGIGVIDSGVGGLTVAKEIMRQLPMESIYYFGDTARCPYGPRPKEQVRAYTLQMVRFLDQFHLKALVIACNTATAVVLEEIEQEFPIPVIGVIDPGARAALKETKTGKIGVIGTVGTIHSGAYEKALKRLNPKAEVYSLSCPKLVPLVESGIHDKEHALRIVQESLNPLRDLPIDTLILGCTHYPFLTDIIGKVMGDRVKLISSAEETALELSTVLYYQGLLREKEGSEQPKHKLFVSGDSTVMEEMASTFITDSYRIFQADLEN